VSELLDEVVAWCDDVTLGIFPACEYVNLAAERFLRDLERQGTAHFPFVFQEAQAKRVIDVIQMFPHIKGPLAGHKIILEPWQKFIFAQPYGWYTQTGEARRFKTAYNEIPRGNGKTAMAAPLCIYATALDGEGGAEVYSAATSRDQAKLSWNVAKSMIRKSPEFVSKFGIELKAKTIEHPESDSFFLPLSAEGNYLDGLNIHLALIDEHHAHKTREVTDVIVTGAGKRPRSLIFVITTAGDDTATVCYEYHDYTAAILKGSVQDETWFGIIFGVDSVKGKDGRSDEDNWLNEDVWRKANPNLGISVDIEYLRSLAKKASRTPAAQGTFKRKHLNIWCKAGTSWMPMDKFKLCKNNDMELEDFEGKKCFISVDLAAKIDLAVKTYTFVEEDPRTEELKVFIFHKYWLPEEANEEDRNALYPGWVIEGYIDEIPGAMIDMDIIEESIKEDLERFDVEEVVFDPWEAKQMMKHISDEGAEVVEVPATTRYFSPAMKFFMGMVLSRRVEWDGNPVTEWCVSNIKVKPDKKDNIYPYKDRDKNKIDGGVTIILAMVRILHNEEGNFSDLDEEEGLTFI
jgi:phage terminase large subunit-like protein